MKKIRLVSEEISLRTHLNSKLSDVGKKCSAGMLHTQKKNLIYSLCSSDNHFNLRTKPACFAVIMISLILTPSDLNC